MKKFWIILLPAAIIFNGNCINASVESQSSEKAGTIKKNESASVTIGRDLLKVEETDSTFNIKAGNRGITILESLENGNNIRVDNYTPSEDSDRDNEDHDRQRRRSRFRGHWSGIELGFNNYSTSGINQALPDNIDYMTLHSGKSTNFNINFSQISLGITRHIGFVTGLGLNWNNYRFDGNNNIVKGNNGVIEELDPGARLSKSKLATLFMTLPFMLEMQIRANHNNLSLGFGPIGAIKLGSHTKMVFENGEKVKSNGDFSLNMLRYGATARVGYGNFQVYGTYYKTPLFQTGKGPAGVDLFPYEIGIALTFND